MKKKLELVHDWKYCRKWLSFKFSALGGTLMASWLMLDKLKEYVPAEWLAIAAMSLFIIIPIVTLINQGKNERNNTNP